MRTKEEKLKNLDAMHNGAKRTLQDPKLLEHLPNNVKLAIQKIADSNAYNKFRAKEDDSFMEGTPGYAAYIRLADLISPPSPTDRLLRTVLDPLPSRIGWKWWVGIGVATAAAGTAAYFYLH